MKPDEVVGEVVYLDYSQGNPPFKEGIQVFAENLTPEVQALIEAGEKAAKLEKLCPDCNYQWDDKVRETEECGNPCHDTLEAPSAPVVKEPVIGLDRERLLEWAEENLDDFDYMQLAGEMAVGKFDLPATPVEPQGIPPCAECGSPTESGLCYHADKCSYKPTVAPEPPKETDRRCSHWIRWPHECDDCLEDARKFLKAPKATDHVDGERREG